MSDTEKVVELGEAVAAGAVAGAQPLDLADDEARVLEDLQVLRHRRLREPELVDELAAIAGVVREQQPHDPDAGRMAECLREQRDVPLDRGSGLDDDAHDTWRAAAAIPAGAPTSDLTRGISCRQA